MLLMVNSCQIISLNFEVENHIFLLNTYLQNVFSFTGTISPVDELVLDCKIQGTPFKMTLNAVYDCLAASCDASKYDEHIANLNSDPEMQELMDSMGAECSFNSAYHVGLGAGMVVFALAFSSALFA